MRDKLQSTTSTQLRITSLVAEIQLRILVNRAQGAARSITALIKLAVDNQYPTAIRSTAVRNRAILLSVIFVIVAATALGQLTIDATGPIRGRTREATGGRGGGVGRKLALQVTMETTVSAPDTDGKTLVEFILTNSGDKNLTIPTSPHSADFEPKDPKVTYTVISLGLRVSRSRKPGIIFPGGADLYGSADVPASLVSLAPYDSVRILSRVTLPGPGPDKVVATATLDKETLQAANRGFLLDSRELGFAVSQEYTLDSLLQGRK